MSERKPLLPPVYLLFAVLAMVGLHFVWPVAKLIEPPWIYIGAIPFIGGGVVVLWAATLFRRAGTTIKPFEESSSLLLQGPYRFSRNPIYLSMVISLLGLAIGLGSLTPFVVPPLFAWLIDTRFIGAEERSLQNTFGTAYEGYRARVRRWL